MISGDPQTDSPQTDDAVDPERTLYRLTNVPVVPVIPPENMVHLLRPMPMNAGRITKLTPGSLIIGRAENNDLVLDGHEVSRRHCRVDLVGNEVIAGGEAMVTDLGSTNGTFVDDVRITGPMPLSPGARLVIGAHALIYERRSREEIEEAERLVRELERANKQVLAILPLPLREGPVRAEWFYQPCAALGGDAFGYRDLGDGVFAGYLLGVAGQGVHTAMHSIAVSNMLRLDALQGADPHLPAAILAALNRGFPLESQGGLTLSIFYWVYESASRSLSFSAAGHHPAYMLPADRSRAVALAIDDPAIGVVANGGFAMRRIQVPPGAMLYLFSDGVFAIEDVPGRSGQIEDFVARLVLPPIPGLTEPQRLYTLLRAAARPGPLDDDLCLVVVEFP